ncbi:unnamed protein product [Schistosoma haematobium]|nr:unnamed protein product [Schistosoma haematobium]CAH8650111.1 unnamed protein product [Schistosoma haematobium]
MEILNSERLISIGWVNLRTSMSNTQEFSNNRAKVYCYIFSNGKITIFYENIPIEMEDKLGDLSISDGFKYNQMNEVPKGLVYSRIQIPTSMVKSGTLVELMPTKAIENDISTTQPSLKQNSTYHNTFIG